MRAPHTSARWSAAVLIPIRSSGEFCVSALIISSLYTYKGGSNHVEVAEGWSGIVGSLVSRSGSVRSEAARVRGAQGAVTCEPGMEQAHRGLYQSLFRFSSVLRRACRPPRVRRPVAGSQQSRNQARNRPPARRAQADRRGRSEDIGAAREI